MKKLTALTAIAAVLMTGTAALGAANYDSAADKITVSGGKYVNVTVAASDTPLSDIGKADSDGSIIYPIFTKSYLPEEKIEIKMPSVNSGYYSVWAGNSLELKFFYVNRSEADEFISSVINKASGAADIKKIIDDNFEKIGLSLKGDKTDLTACDILYKNIPFKDYSSFSSCFSDALKKAAAYASESTDEFIKALSDNGIDTAAIKRKSAKIQAKCLELFKESDISKRSLEEIFKECLAVSECVQAEHYTVLKSAVENNADILSVSLSGDYKKLKDNTQVFIKMLDDVSSCKSAEEIKKLFDDGIEYAYKKENSGKSGSSSSGGGGGGGGSSARPSVTTNIGTVKADEKPQGTKPAFNDLAGAEWAQEAISALAAEGVINGKADGVFDPFGSVTRAEAAKMIYIAFSVSKGSASFADVSEDSWYADAVSSLASAGILKGDGERFYPENPVTREDLAVMLMRAAQYKGKALEGEKSFNDSAEISDYAKEAVSAMAANGIINGADGSFLPKSNANRAQTAVLIYNLKKAM